MAIDYDPWSLCSVGCSFSQIFLQPLQLLGYPPAREIGVEVDLSGIAGEREVVILAEE